MDKKFLLLLSVPALVMIGFLLYNTATIVSGEEIRLKVVRPIDPHDMFRGNYVILSYDISRFNQSSVLFDAGFNDQDVVYGTLVQNGEFWRLYAVSHQRPQLMAGQVCMKGTIESLWSNEYRVEWGIESFFASPEIAHEIEDGMRNHPEEISAVIVADDFCKAILKSMQVGETVYRTR